MGDEGMTAKELAALIGVVERTVRKLEAAGVVVKAGRGRYRRDESVRRYCDHLRKASVATAADERARLARAKADWQEMKNESARGSLIEAAGVESAWSDILRGVRAGLLAVPGRVQQRLAHLTAA